MAESADAAATAWYAKLTQIRVVPSQYRYITRIVSWFFVGYVPAANPEFSFADCDCKITLALLPILPIILLVTYDFLLWLWRLNGARTEALRQSRRTERGTARESETTAGTSEVTASIADVTRPAKQHVE